MGVSLSAGTGLPPQQQTGRLGRQIEALRRSAGLLGTSATGLAQPGPALPSGGPSLNAPYPTVVPEPSSSLAMPPSVGSAPPLGWSQGVSGQVPMTPSLQTVRCPPSCLTQNHGALSLSFSLLPAASQFLTHGGSWPHCHPSVATTPELGRWRFLTSLRWSQGTAVASRTTDTRRWHPRLTRLRRPSTLHT